MPKLAIIIPAYNEERTIGKVLSEISKKIDGIDDIEAIVIDDGSSDRTAEISRNYGATVVSFKKNQGLASAYKTGLDMALERKADIVVSIDADAQYDAREIPLLIKIILEGKSDIVLGHRFWVEDMPLSKRLGNKLATFVTRLVSGFPVSDAQTGFRAFSREAALKINILGDYTYVQETIIQAVQKGLVISEVPIHFRKRADDSRLITNIFSYAWRASLIILKTARDYRPFATFGIAGLFIIVLGILAGFRVLLHYFRTGLVTPYIPTAILTAVLLIMGLQFIILGFLADMIGNNRKVLEEILYKVRKDT